MIERAMLHTCTGNQHGFFDMFYFLQETIHQNEIYKIKIYNRLLYAILNQANKMENEL